MYEFSIYISTFQVNRLKKYNTIFKYIKLKKNQKMM